MEESAATGEAVQPVLRRKAEELGAHLGESDGAVLLDVLERYGFEPGREERAVVLGNWPFHALARDHTETVCGMNLHLLRGVLRGLGECGYTATLAPGPGRCCVRLEPAA
ncbi:hypothetical protein [Streptomyces sp. NBC_00425]|uniref:hypothetical protein n=1 Tax=Streptomyces sp. NBC_00425 TaxID=2975740 RepID=UPI002E1AF4E5